MNTDSNTSPLPAAWFAASILFRAAHKTRQQLPPLWQESILLVRAASEAEARLKAEIAAAKQEIEYEALDGGPTEPPGLIKWTRQSREIQRADEGLDDGSEVFSRFLREGIAKGLTLPFDE